MSEGVLGGSLAPARLETLQATAQQGWIVIATSWLAVAAAAVVAPVAPQMAAHFAATPGAEALVQLSIGLPALFVALLAAPFGFLADRIGRRPVMLGALGVYAACGAAPTLLATLPQILLSRAGVGVAEAAVMATGTALIGDMFRGPERAKWFAIQGGSATLVAIALIAISGALGGTGWRTPFAIYLAPALLLVLVGRFMPEQGRSQRSEEESSPGVSLWRRVAPVAAVTFFAALAFYVVLIQLPFLLADRGMTEPADAALGVAAAAIAAPLGALLFRRLGRRSVAAKLALSFAFSAAGLATIVGVAAFPLILVGAAINGIGSGMALPKLMTWAMAGSRLEERGRVAGLWNGCFFLGQFMSPLAFMAIAAASGQRAGGFVVFASLTGASAVAAALVSRIALRRAAPAAALVRPESNA